MHNVETPLCFYLPVKLNLGGVGDVENASSNGGGIIFISKVFVEDAYQSRLACCCSCFCVAISAASLQLLFCWCTAGRLVYHGAACLLFALYLYDRTCSLVSTGFRRPARRSRPVAFLLVNPM